MNTQHFRPATERGHVSMGWLDSRHTFSFGHFYDPNWMGFGPLRVINEDRVQPGKGFQTHGHANMEILSFVLSGHLAHKDTLGTQIDLHAGDVQCMSAGSGIEHSEFNGSNTEAVHFLQVWIQPDRVNAAPRHAQRNFPRPAAGEWVLIASADGEAESLPIRQDARVFRGAATADAPVSLEVAAGRKVWVQMIEGQWAFEGQMLTAGDGLGIDVTTGSLQFSSPTQGEALVFDLPA
ncbi:pirin family protein [Lysobacter sp. HDW10]|uniref:pirin family protein n=1 Tax=Lysobacter sp. HDW10 TaxID=2714936 RepID=UPI0014083BBE|nr:pirin family protein [Lysobacter sp. HDW10]QIK80500.1 pirin family protein [Lysobacter sp. HDW10]